MTDKELIHAGKLISLYKQKIPLADNRHTYYDIVTHPGGAVIAAINEKGLLCLITQPRPAVDQDTWEFPAGCLEPNEPPLETAKRELEEETGIVARQWDDLGMIVPTPGFCDEKLHLFVATQLSETSTNFDDGEQIESHWLNILDIDAKISAGIINDAKTLSLLYKLRSHDSFKHLWKDCN